MLQILRNSLIKFANSSIKLKMTLMAVMALLGFSYIVFSNYSFFTETNQKLKQVQDIDSQLVRIGNRLQIGFLDVNRLFEAAIAENEYDTLAAAMDHSTSQRKDILRITTLKPSLASRSHEMLASFDQYISDTQKYTLRVLNGEFSADEMHSAIASTLKQRKQYDLLVRNFNKTVNNDFDKTLDTIRIESEAASFSQFVIGTVLVGLVLFAIIWLIIVVTSAIGQVIKLAGQIAEGNLDVEVGIGTSTEVNRLFMALATMRDRLKKQYQESAIRTERQEQISRLNDALRGELTTLQVSNNILRCLAELLGANVGALYLLEGDTLVMKASYAFSHRKGDRTRFLLGESMVGQAALERKLFMVRDLPADYAPVASGLGEATATEVMLVPLEFNGNLLAVIELMSFTPFTEHQIDFVERSAEGLAIALSSAISRMQLADALERTRLQAEAMEQQQEELRATNEELEEQATTLRASEEGLQQQQEELRVMNEELEERNQLLDRQKEEIAQKNKDLEASREELHGKAKQLEMSGRYKTEFLSTMSHELRTPLNSILILSQGLVENKKRNLDEKQVEHAKVINSSGRDLLMLINDILDLSKVEEGKLELVVEELNLQAFADKLHGQFDVQAENKKIGFGVEVEPELPDSILIDEHRLSQILRNFISNALKFTHKGSVNVSVGRAETDVRLAEGHLLRKEDAIVFKVKDSGIGIPKDKLGLIFEAFKQVDGTISRKYGGTGLGLTISKKLAEIMGGGVDVLSEGENFGSEFVLYLPRTVTPGVHKANDSGTEQVTSPAKPSTSSAEPLTPAGVSSEDAPFSGAAVVREKTVLIIEDDPSFSGVLKNLAEDFGFEAHCAHTVADARAYLNHHLPGSIILDLGLPDAPGEHLLSMLKEDKETRNIPVHVISGKLNVNVSDLAGAEEFIAKPFSRDRLDQLFQDIESEIHDLSYQRVLIIEDDEVQCEQLKMNFDKQNIASDIVSSGEHALSLVNSEHYGAIILDLELPDVDGFGLAKALGEATLGNTPIIIYTARDLNKKQDADLRKYAKRIVLKTDKSISRLINETTLFLHWVNESDKTPNTKEWVDTSPSDGLNFVGKRLLLVDDDIRNLYSLSAVLEESGFEIETASTGIEALDMLASQPAFDLVLMDVMMPEMDGLEAMKKIRSQSQFKSLPLIALTAKAMRDDRARCIEAGANDYLSKPVETVKLKSMIKMWLRQN
ncbi:MAG: response regulator [Ketobacter sp.]|nr:MAG: response regulator [Ketobacter sp.]